MQLNSCRCQIVLVHEDTTFPQTQGHDITYVFRFGNDLRFDEWFFYPIRFHRIRHLSWIVDDYLLTLCCISNKTYVGYYGNYSLIEFSFQSFLDDLHSEQSKKSASKNKSKCL